MEEVLMKLGSKVYVWSLKYDHVVKGTFSGEEIIGTVIRMYGKDWPVIEIHSILDDKCYVMPAEEVFEVGTGPAVDKHEVIYEDYYV